jgi:hypothetical protein
MELVSAAREACPLTDMSDQLAGSVRVDCQGPQTVAWYREHVSAGQAFRINVPRSVPDPATMWWCIRLMWVDPKGLSSWSNWFSSSSSPFPFFSASFLRQSPGDDASTALIFGMGVLWWLPLWWAEVVQCKGPL